jgi:hypothetical protein
MPLLGAQPQLVRLPLAVGQSRRTSDGRAAEGITIRELGHEMTELLACNHYVRLRALRTSALLTGLRETRSLSNHANQVTHGASQAFRNVFRN